MPSSGRPQRIRSLSSGRPKGIVKSISKHQSAKATRTTIRTHHILCKELARAESANDAEAVSRLTKAIDANGGLKAYQSASVTGQSISRGGDSSSTLVQWLREDYADALTAAGVDSKLKVLEIGCLSTNNALSTCGLFDVTRIDLESQEKGILKQDFMQRPLPRPEDDDGRFDLISMSLVLNYVPSAEGRGEMLRRTCSFLKHRSDNRIFPALFLVLPAPCVANSRYLNAERLEEIMDDLGYSQVCRKTTSKLIYYLWSWTPSRHQSKSAFSKQEVNPGRTRNNFAIVIK